MHFMRDLFRAKCILANLYFQICHSKCILAQSFLRKNAFELLCLREMHFIRALLH